MGGGRSRRPPYGCVVGLLAWLDGADSGTGWLTLDGTLTLAGAGGIERLSLARLLNVIHVRFLQQAPDDEAAQRLGRLLAGVATDDDLAALAPPPKVSGPQAAAGRRVRDPRQLPGWRPGFRELGEGGPGQRVTAGAQQ